MFHRAVDLALIVPHKNIHLVTLIRVLSSDLMSALTPLPCLCSALGRLRFTSLALLVLLAGCWSLGVTATFYGHRELVISEAVLTALLAVALGLLCADTFIAGSRPWGGRVRPLLSPPRPAGRHPANLRLTTAHPAGGGADTMVRRTFHFGADPTEADRKALFAMPTPE